MDVINRDLYARYKKSRQSIFKSKVLFGQARKAVLSTDKESRKACNLSGNCLWGCSRRSLYSASDDLATLRARPGFRYQPGRVVEKLDKTQDGWLVSMRDLATNNRESLTAARVILAAGTLATTRLALTTLEIKTSRSLLSCPTAAFLVWSPAHFGQPLRPGFGLAQLSYSVHLDDDLKAFGSTFTPVGIPVADFVRYLPFGARSSVKIMRSILSSCVIGNIFLPGQLTNAQVQLDEKDNLVVRGDYNSRVNPLMKKARKYLSRALFRMHAVLMPGSFTIGKPGSDIHYAGTLPMTRSPKLGETNQFGELYGTEDMYIVDGACIPVLPEQSHTLTIMANADRIGRHIASK